MRGVNRRIGSGIEYLDEPQCIWGMNNTLPLIEKNYLYTGLVVPNRMVKDRKLYEITNINPIYYIHGFVVIVENDKVQNILLFGYHPNRDPDTNLYCLKDEKKNQIFDNNYLSILLKNIKTYYLDNCFYIPGAKHVEYKLMKSMHIELNEGE